MDKYSTWNFDPDPGPSLLLDNLNYFRWEVVVSTCIRTVVWPATAVSWTGWPSRLWMWWLLLGIRSSRNFCKIPLFVCVYRAWGHIQPPPPLFGNNVINSQSNAAHIYLMPDVYQMLITPYLSFFFTFSLFYFSSRLIFWSCSFFRFFIGPEWQRLVLLYLQKKLIAIVEHLNTIFFQI